MLLSRHEAEPTPAMVGIQRDLFLYFLMYLFVLTSVVTSLL